MPKALPCRFMAGRSMDAPKHRLHLCDAMTLQDLVKHRGPGPRCETFPLGQHAVGAHREVRPEPHDQFARHHLTSWQRRRSGCGGEPAEQG
jgi:hypothetical protein